MSQGVRKGDVGIPSSDQSDRRPLEMADRAIGGALESGSNCKISGQKSTNAPPPTTSINLMVMTSIIEISFNLWSIMVFCISIESSDSALQYLVYHLRTRMQASIW